MQVCYDLEAVKATGEDYDIRLRVSKALFPFFKEALYNMGQLASELDGKARLAERQSEVVLEAHRQKVEARDQEVFTRIRARYKEVYEDNERAALKVITREFKDYWWIRARFRKEIKAGRELEVMRLFSLGLTSKQIGSKIGLHSGTVRKILLKVEREKSL